MNRITETAKLHQWGEEPELCATKSDCDKRDIDCGVLFAAQIGWCQIGCGVLSSRVPGRRDAALHENMLWSHALPIQVLRVKTAQPSLNLSFFGHESHVSRSIYRLMLCDKRHCFATVVVWAWQYQLQTIQHHHYSTIIPIVAQTHSTQYQPEKTNISVASVW